MSCLGENLGDPFIEIGYTTDCGWLRNPAPVDRRFIPLFFRVSTIQGGAGFLPSTVSYTVATHNGIDIADTLRLECLKQFRILWWFWWTLEGEISKPRAEAGRQICWAVHLLLLLHSDSLWWNHYIVNEKQRCPLLGMCTHGWLSFVVYFLPKFMYVAMSETLFHFKFRVWNFDAMMKVPLCSTTFHLHIPPAWLRLQCDVQVLFASCLSRGGGQAALPGPFERERLARLPCVDRRPGDPRCWGLQCSAGPHLSGLLDQYLQRHLWHLGRWAMGDPWVTLLAE